MFSRPVVISMIIAILLIIFSEWFIFWIVQKSKIIEMPRMKINLKKKKTRRKKTGIVCKACGADNPPENNSCGSCGKPL